MAYDTRPALGGSEPVLDLGTGSPGSRPVASNAACVLHRHVTVRLRRAMLMVILAPLSNGADDPLYHFMLGCSCCLFKCINICPAEPRTMKLGAPFIMILFQAALQHARCLRCLVIDSSYRLCPIIKPLTAANAAVLMA
jgi:hypothetical protein